MTVSEFEYSYFDPGLNLSLLGAKDSRTRGGGAFRKDFRKAFLNALVPVKSGIPLVCCKSSRSVTPAQAEGKPGSHLPMVSPRERRPPATSERATAPPNAFETLATRIESNARIGAPSARSALPAR